MTRKIAITGPESTGKSKLSKQLADHYGTVWVPEFARDYIDTLGRPYEEGDILTIAHGQLNRERDLEQQANNYLFCDTDLMVTKIWSDVAFKRCDPWILESLVTHTYDLYLLCNIDTPWEYDPQREHPQMREHLFSLYYNEMIERGWNFRVVSGLGGERLQNAINWIEGCFNGC